MKIKTINISNYRKIQKAMLNMEDSITVIAGANNSGKTSLVELFNTVFGSSKSKLSGDDFPAVECQRWSDCIYSVFSPIATSGKSQEETISEWSTALENQKDALSMPPIEVAVQIDYDEATDDIRCFADYIMELDPSSTSFYFIYRYDLNRNRFKKLLSENYEKFQARFTKLTGNSAQDKGAIQVIKEMFVGLYVSSCEESVYFSDKSFQNIEAMDLAAFKELFNYRHIMAGRNLDDENSDRAKILSKSMIDIASQEEDWKTLIRDLPDKILQPIQEAQIREKVQSTSLDTLSTTMAEISKTNGGQAGHIVIDMDIDESSISSLLKNITSAKYETDNYYLSESSQGLGYSNLIYIHLQLEKFKKTVDPLAVNFFVIEEPEAHMHPQMQNVFAKYLFDYYQKETGIQCVLTTHSHEVIRTTPISQIRVLRPVNQSCCQLYDLRQFQDSIQAQKDLVDFYDWFHAVNFPDLIFADKIILYEGDTERMFIKSLLQTPSFEALGRQYISYVQVGGAYAFKYQRIIEFLGIKAALITDIDYAKNSSVISSICSSYTTNPTIEYFAKQATISSKVEELYKWKESTVPLEVGHILLAFQGRADSFSRTLEEAMLAKYYNMSAIDLIPKKDWREKRKSSKLKFTVPQGSGECSIRTIVSRMSNRKSDFMYSVIINGLAEAMLPAYIKEALEWLEK